MSKRVLHVYPQLNCGGTEMVFYNLIKYGDRDIHTYEILTQRPGENETPFTDMDIQLHCIPFEAAADYHSRLVDFFRKERFDVVHAHMHTELPIVLRAAKDAGIECRVAHSHNARVDLPRWVWPLFYHRHHPYEKYATALFGCSALALRWLFPGRWRTGHVIHNGIDLDKFSFDPVAREQLRERYNIAPSTTVFINVGRCTKQKNQSFILDLAAERLGNDELYIIIGDGPLMSELTARKEHSGLDNVLLLGKQDDVTRWLSAADVFLFPSVYEGLGIVAVEAQATGLPVLASDTIPPEADMALGTFHRLTIKDKTAWHKLMDNAKDTANDRHNLSTAVLSSPYNIKNVTKTVESLYSSPDELIPQVE